MILVLDVGNTNIVIGVFEGRNLIESWRVSTNENRTSDEYGILLRELFICSGVSIKNIKTLVISSVVPPVMVALEQMSKRYFDLTPLIVSPGVKTGMAIKYENPKEIGADRIVNAIAGIELYGTPLIIVDFGTATTFCAISGKGEYLGGAISPGVSIATEALFSKAAKLPRVEILKPPFVIGRNTIDSMQSGIFYGYVGLVDGMVRRIKKELRGKSTVVATGGLAELIAEESTTIDRVDPFLTLIGLRIIYERNKLQE